METKNQQKKRTQLSFIIRDPVEKLNRSGINCVKFECGFNQADRLFTGGRDSIIRVYTSLIPQQQQINLQTSVNDSTVSSSSLSTSPNSIADRYYQMSLSHHTDWINDLVICKTSKTIFSASSDTTVKIWNSTKGTLLNTLKLHKDYVKCLSYASDKELLASAGFDKNIFLWDISTGIALNSLGSDAKTISDNKYSIYSLAMNNQGTVLASGSPENCIRIWDPRTCAKSMKLKGHSHNIRALILNRDGTQCLSASSDHTIRLWSLGQQRCISTIEIHTEGVWALCVNESFSKVYSGGKDCRVYSTDLRNLDESVLICEESFPILNLDFGHNQESLWVSTTNSSVKNWSLKPNTDVPMESSCEKSPVSFKLDKNNSSLKNESQNHNSGSALNAVENNTYVSSILSSSSAGATEKSNKSSSSSLSSSFLVQNPLNTQPLITIRGTASIKQYHILNDKRTIVTKDSDENVCVWDVLQAKKQESLGKENYEHAIKQRQRFISIPNWFTVDLKLGLLTITLDENEWNSAWINFKDMDSNHVRGTQNIDLSDAKVNYGCIFLESLFKNCLFINPLRVQTCVTVIYSSSVGNNTQTNSNCNNVSKTTEEEQKQAGLLRFNISEHIPIIFSEVAGRTLHRTEVKELSKENEQETISNVMPLWIIDTLVNKNLPKFNRVVFVLNPFNQHLSKTINKDRLSSIDLLQVKKLKEHVYQKILKLDENMNSQQQQYGNSNENTSTSSCNENNNVLNKENSIISNNNNNNSSSQASQKQSNSTNSLINSTNSLNGANQNDLSIANRIIELTCSDTALTDPEMNLRTIKHLVWKGNGDLTILYRVKS